MSLSSKFAVEIISPKEVLYKGDVRALSLYNDFGPFDIIERHTNFISVITDKIIIHDLQESKKEIAIEQGIVRVSETGVEIFVGFNPGEE